jgi:hypothetical protein
MPEHASTANRIYWLFYRTAGIIRGAIAELAPFRPFDGERCSHKILSSWLCVTRIARTAITIIAELWPLKNHHS